MPCRATDRRHRCTPTSRRRRRLVRGFAGGMIARVKASNCVASALLLSASGTPESTPTTTHCSAREVRKIGCTSALAAARAKSGTARRPGAALDPSPQDRAGKALSTAARCARRHVGVPPGRQCPQTERDPAVGFTCDRSRCDVSYCRREEHARGPESHRRRSKLVRTQAVEADLCLTTVL